MRLTPLKRAPPNKSSARKNQSADQHQRLSFSKSLSLDESSDVTLDSPILSAMSSSEGLNEQELRDRNNVLEKQVTDLEAEKREFKIMLHHTEACKLELLNHCNKLEERLVQGRHDTDIIEDLRTQNERLLRKQANIEHDFLDQIKHWNKQVVEMQQKQHKQLEVKDEYIAHLKEKLEKLERNSKEGDTTPYGVLIRSESEDYEENEDNENSYIEESNSNEMEEEEKRFLDQLDSLETDLNADLVDLRSKLSSAPESIEGIVLTE